MADREKLELDDKWHSKHGAPGTGKKRKDLDGLNADVDTEVVDCLLYTSPSPRDA